MLKRLVFSLQCGFDSFTKKLDSRNYRFISGSGLQSGLSWFCCFYCGCIICFEIIYYGEDSFSYLGPFMRLDILRFFILVL